MSQDRTLLSVSIKKCFILIICLLAFLIANLSRAKPALAEGAPSPLNGWWLEIGSNIGYQRTNAWFTVQKNFEISILAAKGGYRFTFKNIHFLFIDPYFTETLSADLRDQAQNKFFWNNNVKYGPGIRVRAEYKKDVKYYEPHGPQLNYANLDYFAEYLGIGFIPRGEDIPNNIPRNDFKTGLNSWISIDNNVNLGATPFRGGVWFEMWSELAHHTTNFFLNGDNNFDILTLSPKVGLRTAYDDVGIALEPYFRFDYVRDFLNKDWNKQAWSNNTDYGPGIRLSLSGLIPGLRNVPNAHLYIYTEYVDINYASRVGSNSVGLSRYDFRTGINLWIPFGASTAPGPTY